ncbi:hypothetical protein [Kribbella deserti]|uniref:Uncharacterized protein n=1 Tax=Kribbella deserti TaxID=1926257 RepID=A0ABV6QKN7_9ACTN
MLKTVRRAAMLLVAGAVASSLAGVASAAPQVVSTEGPSATIAKGALGNDLAGQCRALVREFDEIYPGPGSAAKVVARIDSRVGSSLILADGKRWAACDNAHLLFNGGSVSLRAPGAIKAPAITATDAFAVSNLVVPKKPGADTLYERYWAAGVLPAGITKIRYTFPDGVTKNAKITGKFWLLQHQEAAPYQPGERAQIKVALYRANGSLANSFKLVWGEQTCAHVNHGC